MSNDTFEISYIFLNPYIAKYALFWQLVFLWLRISWNCDVISLSDTAPMRGSIAHGPRVYHHYILNLDNLLSMSELNYTTGWASSVWYRGLLTSFLYACALFWNLILNDSLVQQNCHILCICLHMFQWYVSLHIQIKRCLKYFPFVFGLPVLQILNSTFLSRCFLLSKSIHVFIKISTCVFIHSLCDRYASYWHIELLDNCRNSIIKKPWPRFVGALWWCRVARRINAIGLERNGPLAR